MITIIHGDDNAKSRKFFIDKKGKSSIPVMNGEKISLVDIKQLNSTGGLFEKPEPIFIENLISSSKAGKRLDEISDYLKINSKELEIYLWERKELTKKQTGIFGASVILETFKIPKNTFGFLDSLTPGNGKRNIELFHNALLGSSDELLFFMLVRQFRLLLAVSSNSDIDEMKRLVLWQKTKLLSQAKLFSKDKLLKIYNELYKIDYAQKTGGLLLPLSETIDFFLLGL